MHRQQGLHLKETGTSRHKGTKSEVPRNRKREKVKTLFRPQFKALQTPGMQLGAE